MATTAPTEGDTKQSPLNQSFKKDKYESGSKIIDFS